MANPTQTTTPAGDTLLPKLMALAAAVLILAGMRVAAPILNPLLLALLLAMVFRPLVRAMVRRGLKEWVANTVVLLTVPALLTGVGFLVAASARQLTGKLPAYQEKMTNLALSTDSMLKGYGIDAAGQLTEAFDVQRAAGIAASLIGNFLDSLGAFLLVLFFFLFLLIEAGEFPRKLRAALGRGNQAMESLHDFGERMVRYASTKTWLGLAAGVLNTIFLLIVGVDFAFLWGVLSFLLSFVPNLGYLISVIPPTLLALVESGWVTAVIVLIGFQVINFVIDSVIGPRFLGDDLDLSPAVTIIAVFFWGWLMGAAGTLLALPLTIAVKLLVLERHPESRWLATLIGGMPRKERGVGLTVKDKA